MAKLFEKIEQAGELLKNGGIVASPTDTLYGILGDSLNQSTVERIYQIKGRNPKKPLIILIPSVEYLSYFGITPSPQEEKLLNTKGITVVIDLKNKDKYQYLHRGVGSLAFRIPDKQDLINLMEKIQKPLTAPSCNPEGKPPAKNVEEAIKYFGESIDGYVKSNTKLQGKPSTLVKIKDKQVIILREGKTPLEEILKILG